jgi:predicted nucleic acid-binding protein
MSDVFGDTSYFLAILNSDDAAHQRAQRWTLERSGRLVTTQWVLAEVGNFLSAAHLRRLFPSLLESLNADASVNIIAANSDSFDAGTRLYVERPDKDWSLTDCISFDVMRRMGIQSALTGDHHFEQAGFVALLK